MLLTNDAEHQLCETSAGVLLSVSRLNYHVHKMGPREPRTTFLATRFTRKMPESLDSIYFSIFMLENVWHHHLT